MNQAGKTEHMDYTTYPAWTLYLGFNRSLMIITTLDRILGHIHSFWKPWIHGRVTQYIEGSIQRLVNNCLNYIFNVQFIIHTKSE